MAGDVLNQSDEQLLASDNGDDQYQLLHLSEFDPRSGKREDIEKGIMVFAENWNETMEHRRTEPEGF